MQKNKQTKGKCYNKKKKHIHKKKLNRAVKLSNWKPTGAIVMKSLMKAPRTAT